MSVLLTSGTLFAIGTYSGTAPTISAITNANPAVATLSVGHAVIVGDLISITSGWSRLNDRIVRASAVATNDVTLEGINSLATSIYPAGGGVGSCKEVTTAGWTEITQVLDSWAPSGGEINWGQLQYAASDIAIRFPRGRAPVTLSLPFAFDPALPWLAALRNASDLRTPFPLRISYPSGAKAYANAIFNLRDMPTAQDGALVDVLDLSLMTVPTLYAS